MGHSKSQSKCSVVGKGNGAIKWLDLIATIAIPPLNPNGRRRDVWDAIERSMTPTGTRRGEDGMKIELAELRTRRRPDGKIKGSTKLYP